MQEFLVQAIGVIGFIFTVVSYQCKSTKLCFVIQAFAGLSFALHYMLLGIVTASLLNSLNILRGVLLVLVKSEKNKNIVAVVIFILYLAAGILTYGGIASVMATFAQLVGTVTMSTRNGKIYRLGTLLCVSPIWLVHNVMCDSLGGVITEIFTVVSILVFITRFGWKKFFTVKSI